MDTIDISRTFYSHTAEYTFFSASRKGFSKIDHIAEYKASLSKQGNGSDFLSSIGSQKEVEVSSKTNYTKSWKSKNTLLNDRWVVKDIRRQIGLKIPGIE